MTGTAPHGFLCDVHPLRRYGRSLAPLGALLLGTLVVLAAGNSEDRSTAQKLIQELRAQPDATKIAAYAIDPAEGALKRADDVRATGDASHAAQLEGLAREWAELGRDLLRAAQLEREAVAVETQLAETETRSLRARALLEETTARKHRASANLQEAPPPAPVPAPAPKGAK